MCAPGDVRAKRTGHMSGTGRMRTNVYFRIEENNIRQRAKNDLRTSHGHSAYGS